MTTANLDVLVRKVAQARVIAANTQARIDQAKHRWQEENAPLLAAGRMDREHLEIAEMELYSAAIQAYAATQNKRPHPAVGIRIRFRVLYDYNVAEAWSLSHGGISHTFDARKFEGMAKADLTNGIGTLQEMPQATIATDLSAYVPEPLVDIS